MTRANAFIAASAWKYAQWMLRLTRIHASEKTEQSVFSATSVQKTAPQRHCIKAKNKERCNSEWIAPCFLQIQKVFSVIYSKVFGELLHFAVLDCINSRHIASEHINLCRLFNGFDKPEAVLPLCRSAIGFVPLLLKLSRQNIFIDIILHKC